MIAASCKLRVVCAVLCAWMGGLGPVYIRGLLRGLPSGGSSTACRSSIDRHKDVETALFA